MFGLGDNSVYQEFLNCGFSDAYNPDQRLEKSFSHSVLCKLLDIEKIIPTAYSLNCYENTQDLIHSNLFLELFEKNLYIIIGIQEVKLIIVPKMEDIRLSLICHPLICDSDN